MRTRIMGSAENSAPGSYHLREKATDKFHVLCWSATHTSSFQRLVKVEKFNTPNQAENRML